jgi:tryptophan 2,3-dioxygenase
MFDPDKTPSFFWGQQQQRGRRPQQQHSARAEHHDDDEAALRQQQQRPEVSLRHHNPSDITVEEDVSEEDSDSEVYWRSSLIISWTRSNSAASDSGAVLGERSGTKSHL